MRTKREARYDFNPPVLGQTSSSTPMPEYRGVTRTSLSRTGKPRPEGKLYTREGKTVIPYRPRTDIYLRTSLSRTGKPRPEGKLYTREGKTVIPYRPRTDIYLLGPI